MVENTRFEDFVNGILVKYESKNNLELGKYWASLGDVFINDAFGTAHRSHASNVGIAKHIKESGVGYLIKNELEMLSKGLNNPKSPFIAIIGGAKVSDKINVIDNLLKKADKILIGGGMAYTFEVAKGKKIGDSLIEKDKIELAQKYLKNAGDKLVLPIDHAISSEFSNNERKIVDEIPDGYMGLDIGDKTIKLYSELLNGAKTVVWNGPMGVAEFSNFKNGTEAIAQAIANQNDLFSIIGGGDSAAAAIKLGFEDKFTHISTGGGASLQFMEGKTLPGIDAIENNINTNNKFDKDNLREEIKNELNEEIKKDMFNEKNEFKYDSKNRNLDPKNVKKIENYINEEKLNIFYFIPIFGLYYSFFKLWIANSNLDRGYLKDEINKGFISWSLLVIIAAIIGLVFPFISFLTNKFIVSSVFNKLKNKK